MPLKVLVQVWTEIDPTLNVRFDRATSEACAEPGDVLRRISPLGRQGVAVSSDLPTSEVTAFAIGDQHTAALRHALAAGAVRAAELLVADGLDQPALVTALAEWLACQQPDLVVGDRLTGLIAGRLGWSHLAGIDGLHVADSHLLAIRHLGRGERETVMARLPAAVRLWPAAAGPPYISRARLQAVADGRIERNSLVATDNQPTVEVSGLQVARTRTRKSATAQPQSVRGMDRLQALIGSPVNRAEANSGATPARDASPDELADEFVRYLAHQELLPPHKPPG